MKNNQTRQRQAATKRRQRAIRKVISPCLRIGQILSNVAYNCKQRDDVPADVRTSLAQLQRQWDEAQAKVPRWIR